jgi:hypothetical protein
MSKNFVSNKTEARRNRVKRPDPVFEARPLKTAPGWYVRVTWRYGQVEHVSGFASGQDAAKWIEQKSEAWLRGRKGARTARGERDVGLSEEA